jgi:hypothetical protein
LSKLLGISNFDYHADVHHLSSSSLKMILKDPRLYFETYILKQHPQSSADHFAEGSLVHSLILEPHKVATDYAIFPGMRKAGAAWESFKESNLNQICLSQAQMLRCEKLYNTYSSMGAATELIKDGIAEHNMVGCIQGIPVKARADYISPQRNIIIDVKTTSMPSGKEEFYNTMLQYSYHLSAALYANIAWQTYPGEVPFDFYWIVLSKADGQCHVYKASEETMLTGLLLVTKSLTLYKKCLASGEWVASTTTACYDTEDYIIEEV